MLVLSVGFYLSVDTGRLPLLRISWVLDMDFSSGFVHSIFGNHMTEPSTSEEEFLKSCRADLSRLRHERELPGIPYESERGDL